MEGASPPLAEEISHRYVFPTPIPQPVFHHPGVRSSTQPRPTAKLRNPTSFPTTGYDLQGNTFWEFRLSRSTDERLRRIVHYPRSTHYSQVKVSPLWHQWLRHTREEPPSLEEQQGDVVRRARMLQLAAEADKRWEAKPRVMEAPQTANTANVAPAVSDVDGATGGQEGSRQLGGVGGLKNKGNGAGEQVREKTNDPWAKARAQGPGEKWQPTTWNGRTPSKP